MTVNRTHSFCHEYVNATKKSDDVAGKDGKTPICALSAVDLVNYIFYFPLFFYGPVLTYDQFVANLRRFDFVESSPTTTTPSYGYLFKQLMRYVFWALALELTLYHFFFNAALGHLPLLWQVDLWELAGIGFLAGQFFYTKYLVIYGIHNVLSTADGMTPPTPPKCSVRLYLTSDMLQNFDKGFYNFVKRYVYFPLGGSRRGVVTQFFAIFCCFAYIFVWHGCQWYVFYWSALNFVGIVAEAVGTSLQATDAGLRLQSFVGPRMWRRLRVLAALPFFASLAIGMFMFFGMHHEVGRVYYERYVSEDFPSFHFFFALFVMYAQAQSAVTIYKYEETGSVAGYVLRK